MIYLTFLNIIKVNAVPMFFMYLFIEVVVQQNSQPLINYKAVKLSKLTAKNEFTFLYRLPHLYYLRTKINLHGSLTSFQFKYERTNNNTIAILTNPIQYSPLKISSKSYLINFQCLPIPTIKSHPIPDFKQTN